MKTFSITDTGRTREMNQDYVYTSEKSVGSLPNLFIVADGMGGHNAGDYASRYAVEIMMETIEQSKESEVPAILREAIERANHELLKKAEQEPDLLGMGTTAVLAVIQDKHLWVANVGDSRLYVLNDKIKQVTRDHSLVEEMVRKGELEKEEARVHTYKNIITRAIGATEDVAVDIFEMDLKKKDQILMCTDGLTNMVNDDMILSIVKSQRDAAEKVEKLIERANQNGGQDNITAVIIEPFSGEVKTC